MHAMNQLIKMGYEFKTDDDGAIEYKFSGSDIDELTAKVLIGQIKDHKPEATNYLKNVIKMTVNIREGSDNGEYIFNVFDSSGQQIFGQTLQNTRLTGAAEYVNKILVDNARFNNIAAKYNISTGLFTYYGYDTKQTPEYEQVDLTQAARELTPDDPLYYQCPWG